MANVNYSSYGSAIEGLRNQQRESKGYISDKNSLAGSDAAGYMLQAGALEQQRQFDPWGYYRGSAADALATQATSDPSNIYRSKLEGMISGEFNPDDPSYAFRFQQGQQASERSLAARGLLNSGNAAIELQQYGQGMASQEYQAQFDRLLQGMLGVEKQYDTQQQRLMDLAGVGNASIGLYKQKFDQETLDNVNYQMGLGAANQPSPRNSGFGAGAV